MARRYSSEYKNLQPYVVEDIRKVVNAAGAAGGGTVGVTDHGALTGLSDDDHPQYLTPVRGDARYIPSTRTLTAGDGLTGGGDLSADRTFTVGAGDGITVTADNVGLTTPGTLTVSSTNTATGSHTHAITSSNNPGAAASILASSAAGLLTLQNGAFVQAAQSSTTFASGFAGSGWRVDYGITTVSKASAEFDDLVVRGRMRIYELLIQQIRATNGSLFVSSASKITAITATNVNPNFFVNGVQLTFNGSNATFVATTYTIETSTTAEHTAGQRNYHGFLYGDIIRAQRVEWNGSAFAGIMQSNLEVTGVVNLYTYIAAHVSGDSPAVGHDFVRLGNFYDTTRQGSVYITADDSAAPFIDIVDGVYSHATWNSAGVKRVRVGKLTGISDSDFGGPLTGYGLYGNNVYLKGTIYATAGIFSGTLQSSTGMIGGWALNTSAIISGAGANTVCLDSGGFNPAIYAGHATPTSAPFQVSRAGVLTASGANITGTLIAQSGGISGNFYVGSDVGASGNFYVGSNADMRFSSDGIRCILPTSAGADIPTASQAIRWFPSGTTTWSSAISYAGFITYKNPSPTPTVMDLILTSCVGDNDDATLDARVILQAGHYAGGVYTDARLEVVREKSTGLKYVGAYGDLFAVENKIQLTEISDPSNSFSNQAYLFVKDNGSGKTQLCVRFATGASVVIATQA